MGLNNKSVLDSLWIDILTESGFTDITSYIYIPRASGYTNFYTAFYNNEKVFIKCGKGKFYSKREFDITQELYSNDNRHFPKPIMYKVFDNKMFFVTSFIESTTLDKVDIKNESEEKINKMFNSLIEIGFMLNKNGYIYRDFNEKNLLVENDGNIILIDSQHLLGENFPEYERNIINLKKLRGMNKKLTPYPYVWDDMFAIYKILKKFPKSKIIDYDLKMKNVRNKIKDNRCYFFDNKIPFKSYKALKIAIVYKIFNEIFKPLRSFIY